MADIDTSGGLLGGESKVNKLLVVLLGLGAIGAVAIQFVRWPSTPESGREELGRVIERLERIEVQVGNISSDIASAREQMQAVASSKEREIEARLDCTGKSSLVIRSNRSDDAVFLNGVYVGATSSRKQNICSGDYEVRVESENEVRVEWIRAGIGESEEVRVTF